MSQKRSQEEKENKPRDFEELAEALFEEMLPGGVSGLVGKESSKAPKGLARTTKEEQNQTVVNDLISPLKHPQNPRLPVWQKAFAAMLDDLPQSFAEFNQDASDLGHCYLAALADKLQERLNNHLQSLPSETYADKRVIASLVNETLHSHGLAVRCPRTGRPGILVADVQGGVDSASRFRLEIRDETGRRTRTLSSRTLPTLELMEDEVRVEPFSRGFKRSD